MKYNSFNVYVVIVTYNGDKWIKKCLDSVMCSTINVNVVIIDNASSDNTASIIDNFYKDIKIIYLSHNIGFGQANNVGLKYALSNNADYVLLLNQDAMISPNMVSCLIKASNEYPKFGILSPMHYNYEGTRLDPGFIRYCPSDLLNDAFCNNLKEIYDTKMVNAAVWFLKDEVLHSVGGFDPLFFHGGEDDDYVQRTIYHGYKVGIVPNTKAYHSHESFGYDHNFTFSEICNIKYNYLVLTFKKPGNKFIFVFGNYIINLVLSLIVSIILFRYNNIKMKLCVAYRIFPRIFSIVKHKKMLIKKIALPIRTCLDVEGDQVL